MMRLRRASGIAALFLVAWAATAYAECAWVLWKQFEVKTPAPRSRLGPFRALLKLAPVRERSSPPLAIRSQREPARTRKASD
jgi:hypothetical protein